MAGLLALGLSYVMSQFYRSFLAVLSPVLSSELAMSPGELSNALGAWFLTFALAQFAVGPMLDRFGPRITAGFLFGLFAGGGAFLFSIASSGWMIMLAMGLIGIGCAPVLMASVFIFARNYSAARFAVLISWFIAIGSSGNLVGSSPLAWLAEIYNWRLVMAGLAIFTLAIAAAILLLVHDPEKVAGHSSSKGSYFDLIKIRKLWAIIPMMMVAYSLPVGLRGLWAGPYFGEVYGLDTIGIGNITFWIAIAMIFGSILYGPLDTIFNSRKWVIFTGNLIMGVSVLTLAYYPSSSVALSTGLFIAVCMLGLSYAVMMAHARAFYPAHLLGRGVTLMNFFSIGGSATIQLLSGYVFEGSVVVGNPAAGFQNLFWFYGILTIVAVLFYLFSQDAKPGNEGVAQ